MNETVLNPDSDHPITIEPNQNRITVVVAGELIADTHNALTLYEANYPSVQYIPRKDVNMAMLERTNNETYCPYKGECSYFSIIAGGKKSENAAWTYKNPYTVVNAIKEYIAFFPNRVDSISDRPFA